MTTTVVFNKYRSQNRRVVRLFKPKSIVSRTLKPVCALLIFGTQLLRLVDTSEYGKSAQNQST